MHKKILFLFVFSFCFLAKECIAQTLIRGPYMTIASPNSIVIKWRTDLPSNAEIRYGTNVANLNLVSTDLIVGTEHEIKLIGLMPSTKYFYSVGTTINQLQGDSNHFFYTAPLTSKTYEKPIKIWAVGDMAKQNANETAMKEAFKKYVDTNYIDGFLMLGDNSYPSGFDQNFQDGFFNYFQNDITKHTVLWPCVGNHEYANDYSRRIDHQIAYFDIFTLPQNAEMGGIASNNERYYSFDYGNVHFIQLDSYGLENVSGNYYGLADTAFSPQVLWLKYDLAQNTLPWVIASYHHPPYCMGTHNSDFELDLVSLRTNINPLLEKYNVDLVLNGHCHTYQRSNFIRNHFGLANSFDSTLNLIQNSSGKNDGTPNSCMYIKNNETSKDSGTIYAVIGSGSAVPQLPYGAWPHKAMQTSNYIDNGSMFLNIEDNELNAVWISTDTNQVVKDQFTILKNANKKHILYVNYPDSILLKSSWHRAPFFWSTNDSTQKINFYATKDTTVYVHDLYNCIIDTFEIKNSMTLQNIDEFKTLNIEVYPNPTQNKLYLETPTDGLYQCTLFNEKGENVFEKKYETKYKKIEINLSEKLPVGNYFLNIKNDKNHYNTYKVSLIE